LAEAVITKLDVLSGFEKIGIVTGYRLNGHSVGFEAAGEPGLEVAVQYVDGWSEDISGVRNVGELPPAARAYIRKIEELLGVPVSIVSVGPERTQLAVV
jgi:adenylosuccinate synthase